MELERNFHIFLKIFSIPYKNNFGGICAFTKEQFLRMNGFSNDYWGWGGEDDDAHNR